MKNVNSKYHVMYVIMLLVFIFMIIWMGVLYKGPSFQEESFADAIDFSKGWRTEEGNVADIAHLNKLEGVEPNREFSIYHILPEDLGEGTSLYCRSKNIFYKVYINGKIVYEPYTPQNALYTKSFGTRWNCIPISTQDAGKVIEVRITLAYSDARAGMDNLYMGLPGGIILEIIGGKVIAFVSCVLLVFIGMLLIVADIPINMSNQKNHELMYLGMFQKCKYYFNQTNKFVNYYQFANRRSHRFIVKSAQQTNTYRPSQGRSFFLILYLVVCFSFLFFLK